MVYRQDTSFASIVTAFFQQQVSTFSASPDSILGAFNVMPIPYGKSTVDRKVQDPETLVHASVEWDGRRAKKVTLKQNVDAINLSDGIEIPRAEFAADPEGARIHVRDTVTNFRNAVEKTLIAGTTTRAIARGISDFPDGTSGTVNRPEIAYDNTTAGDWSTIANVRTDCIESMAGLIAKKFYGPYAMLAPTLVRPMLSQLIDYAGVATKNASTATYITSTLGIPILYSPFVHEAATKDDFNIYIVDLSKAHIGLSPTMFDAYYEQKDHAYYWDWEVYMAPLFDPIYDGTEYLKGVARLDARDWSD